MRRTVAARPLIATLAAVVLVAIAIAAAAVMTSSAEDASGPAPQPDGAALGRELSSRPLLVRAVEPDRPRADGGLYELTADGEADRAGDLKCKRVHFNGGRGLCLAMHENGVEYVAIAFDRDYRETARAFIEGVPDRARVSPDGRYGGFTSFQEGDAEAYFASARAFKTYTRILDLRSGEEVLRLEDLDVSRDGRRLPKSQTNFWGLTFTEDGRFYATMALRREHFLIEGSVGEADARVVADRVECPSLSPDGTKIAYKRRIGARNAWRFHVMDLESGRDVALAEERSIDDQPEWLDADMVVYSDDQATFAVPADGSGAPRRLARQATSPSPLD